MKDLTPKFDTTGGPTGSLTAGEFNDMRNDAQNLIENTGQTLTAAVGDDNQQFTKAVAVGGKRLSRADTETAAFGDIVLPDNSAGAITINLPLISGSEFVNANVYFEPVDDQLYSVNSLTIGRNSQLIMGLAEDMLLDSSGADNQKIKMTWKGGAVGWVVSKVEEVGSTL